MTIDAVALARALIRRPSVTPLDAGAMDVLQAELERLGFACRRMTFGEIENLYARRGTESPNLCFAGHTDVVPTGNLADWSADPFEAEIRDGVLIGRGDGSFETLIDVGPTGVSSYGIAAADFNGDGKPDLAIANAVSNDLAILLNTSE